MYGTCNIALGSVLCTIGQGTVDHTSIKRGWALGEHQGILGHADKCDVSLNQGMERKEIT